MNFLDALKAVQNGKAVTRKDWNDPRIHVALVPIAGRNFPTLSIFNGVKGGDRYHDWIISQEDMEVEWAETAITPEMAGLATPAKETIIKPAKSILLAKPNSSPVPRKN